jgi:AhpD family alkylhydroperoxidase
MRIDELSVAGLRWYLRPLFWLQRRRWGQVLAPALAWARSPRHYLALLAFYSAIERRGSPLEPALRSLLQVRVSQLTHCEFCMDLNAALAAERAGSMDKARALAQWRESAAFSGPERAALEYAEAMTTGAVDRQLSERVKTLFGEAALVEMTALIAFQNMSARFNAALDLPSQGFCRIGPPPR